jgi:O-antigen ligase
MMVRDRVTLGLQAVVFRGIQFILLLAPLPLGSNRLWAWSLWGCLLGVLLLVWVVSQITDREPVPALRTSLALASGFFVVALVFITLQATCGAPLDLAHPSWIWLTELGQDRLCNSVSLEPARTWTGLARLLGYGAAFYLALGLAHRSRRASELLATGALSGALYAGWGLIGYFAEIRPALFFEEHRYVGFVTSTFVNRNSFAAFAGMGAIANLGFLVDRLLLALRFDSSNPLRAVLEVGAANALYLSGFVVCFTAALLTTSRAGFGATMIGLVALIVCLSVHHRSSWGFLTKKVALLSSVALILILVGGDTLVRRLDQIDQNWAGREAVIFQTLDASLDRPWLGVGYGTFEEAWPAYRSIGLNKWYRQAHSTYAENLFELGYPGALALMLSVAWLLVVCARGVFKRRRNGLYPSVALAAFIIPVTHSTIDFSLQNPAVMITAVVLLGIGAAQSFSSSERHETVGKPDPMAKSSKMA